MADALLIPWRPDGAVRDAIWSDLKRRHLDLGRTVVEGACDGEWCKAAAVADALRRTDANLLVIHDADVWCDGLDEALAALGPNTRWAVPHLQVHRLAEGEQPGGALDERAYRGFLGGGIVVIDRLAYEACPIDPRFVGWGHEDFAWGCALTALYGAPWRGDADLWHWWHPPQARRSRSRGSSASERLEERYRRATGVLRGRRVAADRRQVQALVEEARGWQQTSGSTATASARS